MFEEEILHLCFIQSGFKNKNSEVMELFLDSFWGNDYRYRINVLAEVHGYVIYYFMTTILKDLKKLNLEWILNYRVESPYKDWFNNFPDYDLKKENTFDYILVIKDYEI